MAHCDTIWAFVILGLNSKLLHYVLNVLIWHTPTTPQNSTWLFGLRKFSCQSLRWCWWGMVCQTPHHPQNSTWLFGLRKFSCQSLRWWWGGVWHARHPPTTTPKLNSTFLDLEKWLFMPGICDNILLLPMGNYSFLIQCYLLSRLIPKVPAGTQIGKCMCGTCLLLPTQLCLLVANRHLQD